MRDTICSVNVEFLLEKRIDGRIQIEREPRRLSNPKPTVDVETSRAGHEVCDLRATELVGLFAFRIEDIFGSFAGVVEGHN
jgi:hypothetical protein